MDRRGFWSATAFGAIVRCVCGDLLPLSLRTFLIGLLPEWLIQPASDYPVVLISRLHRMPAVIPPKEACNKQKVEHPASAIPKVTA